MFAISLNLDLGQCAREVKAYQNRHKDRDKDIATDRLNWHGKSRGCSKNTVVADYSIIVFLNAAAQPKQLELKENDKNTLCSTGLAHFSIQMSFKLI